MPFHHLDFVAVVDAATVAGAYAGAVQVKLEVAGVVDAAGVGLVEMAD